MAEDCVAQLIVDAERHPQEGDRSDMARQSIIVAAALASLAVAFVPAAASAKMGQGGITNHGPRTGVSPGSHFNGSGIKIGVQPRIKKDIGLDVRCYLQPANRGCP
jgi:hypothetical protein